MIKFLKIISIFSFIILLYDRILIYFFDQSLTGYVFERVIFFVFLITSIIIAKKSKHKKIVYFSIAFVLFTNFTRAFWTGFINTDDEIRISKNLFLRESSTIETIPVYHIMERSFITEKDLSFSKSILNYDEKFNELNKILKISLIKQDSCKIILKYENRKNIKIDTFMLKVCNQ